MTRLAMLIAGTSSSYLEISRKMLRFHYEQCDVDFAHSARECIEKATTRSYELILFDYELGDQNGLDVVEALRDAGVETPQIMLIDEGDEIKAVQAIEMGASDYILKTRGYLTALPFTVRNILEKKQTGAQPTHEMPEQKTAPPALPARSEGYFILDRKGRVLSANQDIQRITQFSETELLELTISDLLPDDLQKSFYDRLQTLASNGHSGKEFKTELVNKRGERIAIELILAAIKDEHQNVLSYRGRIVKNYDRLSAVAGDDYSVDQLGMVNDLSKLMAASYGTPLNIFLERLAESICQIFRFQRSTIALLDKRKKVFVKQAMVGYASFPLSESRSIEVPEEVITRVFSDRFRIKVLYYNEDHRNTASYLNSKYPERRSQRRRPPAQWHHRDLVLVNLMDREGATFGYISLDRPVAEFVPMRDTFHNIEIYGQLLAFAIENFYQFSALEQRERRMKQILVTSNIFKLHLSLSELMKEVVWSIRFSLNYNLVALGLISKKTGMLEMKAVACEDKIKRYQLSALHFPLGPLSKLMRGEYSCGRAFFVAKQEEVLQAFKHIYYGPVGTESGNGRWPACGLLLVPVKSQAGKIVGCLLVDDPANNKLPDKDTLSILEIMSNQIAVAIDNRILYIKSRQQKDRPQDSTPPRRGFSAEYVTTDGRQRFVDRFFK